MPVLASTLAERIDQANAILATFARGGVQLKLKSGRMAVSWKHWRTGAEIRKTWMTRGQDFYPTWQHSAPWGGTQSTAIAQLIRWVKGIPCYGLNVWKYWASESMQLCGSKTLEMLQAAGYPVESTCVLCGRSPSNGTDWWNLDGVSGPCCSFGRCKGSSN